MWFNSVYRAEPYQTRQSYVDQRNLFFNFLQDIEKLNFSIIEGKRSTGVAWLSSVRVVRCLVDSCNGRDLRGVLDKVLSIAARGFFAPVVKKEFGDHVKSA